ncbi:HipA N-terminal domain-containing protein [Novispirillum sp. DQ9]|uniref:HipA N-terminal domain-containing protein n=1 Tax=Novispirillum sp. DQ9 TaxID=3398612 RepID=UPI003C7B1737
MPTGARSRREGEVCAPAHKQKVCARSDSARWNPATRRPAWKPSSPSWPPWTWSSGSGRGRRARCRASRISSDATPTPARTAPGPPEHKLVGHLLKDPGGAISFRYAPEWLEGTAALPVSLSLPLREEVYKGESVVAVFENLLPDSPAVRQRVAERVGARGTDAYSLLEVIGRDCAGALQFIRDDDDVTMDAGTIAGEPVDDTAARAIERTAEALPEGFPQRIHASVRETPSWRGGAISP